METTLDKFGRIVIPKPVRDRLGVEPGTVLELEEDEEGGVVLRPRRAEPDLVEEEGVVVFTGEPTADLETAVERHRRSRSRGLAAWPSR